MQKTFVDLVILIIYETPTYLKYWSSEGFCLRLPSLLILHSSPGQSHSVLNSNISVTPKCISLI